MSKNILLTIAYDGSRFHGWQRQPNATTVQGHLEETFSRLFRREIRLNGTSRTDAGVHALGQRASFHTDVGIPTERMARVMNNALFGREEGSFALSPVRILQAQEMPPDFHARFDCKGKKYIYRLLPGGTIDIFRRNYVYHVPAAKVGHVPAANTDSTLVANAGHAPAADAGPTLDLAAMQEAAGYLVGTHDFKSFESAGGNPRETTVRTIFDARVVNGSEQGLPEGGQGLRESAELPVRGDEIRIEISGDGFLYNMVRIITGTLVEVGQGKRRPEDMKQIIEARDRQEAGHTAPPYGLYLAEVYYE